MRQSFPLLVAGLVIATAHARGADQSFDSDGVRIHYQDQGEGPPVVLIHGYMASGNMNWRVPGVQQLLGPDYRVITIDNRGHGKSDKPTRAEAYGSNMADDVVRLLDHLQIPKAHLVGYSMGGMISLNVSARYPDRVRSALIGGMGWLPKGPIIGGTEETQLPRPRSSALKACARAFPDLGITRQQLEAIQVPMSVLIGDEDGLLERHVRPMQEIRPDIPVVLVPGGTHISCLFKPKFKESIKEWLDRQPRP